MLKAKTDAMCQEIACLNEAQKQGACHGKGPAVVFAGAGSGKTRVITHRVALLIDSGVPARRILALTFTNKAAKEMRLRAQGLHVQASYAHISTFHSACSKWLREFAGHLGFTPDFSIYDDNDSLQVLRAITKNMNIAKDDVSPNQYKAAISKAKSLGMLPCDAQSDHVLAEKIFPKAGIEVYRRYQEQLAAANAMDFNDLLLNMCLLLRRSLEVRRLLQERYDYVMVDEYQDTNAPQFFLLTVITEHTHNLFVVGDDDQSIYSWRGADPTNILNFHEQYQNVQQIRLEQNYRCSGNIVEAAASLIQNNQSRAEKKIWTSNNSGPLIDFLQEHDGESEAWFICEQIKKDLKIYDPEQIAVFYRTNAQSRMLEDSLRRYNIPYQIFGALRFYDRVEIKDVLAYLRLLNNPRDDVALKRIINVPTRGIGSKALDAVQQLADREKCTLLEAVNLLAQQNLPRISGKFKVFLAQLDELGQAITRDPLGAAVDSVLSCTRYGDYLKKKYPDQYDDKIGNVMELASALDDYEAREDHATLASWLVDISLVGSEEGADSGVILMTLHAAKGLEFDRVFITGFEDGLIPHGNSLDDQAAIEEERRLVYVGITRAKKKLSLTSASRRRVYNHWQANQPSRFLREIPREVLEMGFDHSEESDHTSELSEGSTVSHPAYGRGIVVEVDQDFGSLRVVVDFRDHGKRRVNGSHLH